MLDATKPFRVRTIDGVLRSQHASMSGAEAAAQQANRDAEQLGIKARYRALDELGQAEAA